MFKSGWDLGCRIPAGIEYAYNLPVFKEKERWFKIQEVVLLMQGFTTTGTSGGAQCSESNRSSRKYMDY